MAQESFNPGATQPILSRDMQDNLIRGSMLMLLATVLFSISDTMAKYVIVSVPGVELAAIRYAVFVGLASIPFLRRGRPSMRSRRPGLQLLRGVGFGPEVRVFRPRVQFREAGERGIPVKDASSAGTPKR